MSKTIKLCAVYAFAAFVLNYVSSKIVHFLVGRLALMILGLAKISTTLYNGILLAVVVPLNIAISVGLLYFVLKRIVPLQFNKGDKLCVYSKKAAVLILPGEILRYAFCLNDLGHVNGSGYFCYIPTLFFDKFYIQAKDRFEIRQYGNSVKSFEDYLWFGIIYLLYFVVYGFFLFLAYKKIWKEAIKDDEDMIRHEEYKSRPKFY